MTNSEGLNVRDPIPISTEFDSHARLFNSSVQVNRSEWRRNAMSEVPGYKEMRERSNAISRAVAFGRLYLPDYRYIPPPVLLSLISQHLRNLGLLESQTSLHRESNFDFEIPARMSHSQLNLLVQNGIRSAEKFWDLTHESKRYQNEKERQSALDEEISRTIGGLAVVEDFSQPLENEKMLDPAQIVIDPNTNEVLRASVNQLILLLTSETTVKLTNVATAFCLTYTNYITSQVMFSKIRERFMMVIAKGDKVEIEKTFELFEKWLNSSGGEIEQTVYEAVKIFVEKHLRPNFQRHCMGLFSNSEKSNQQHIEVTSQVPNVNIGKTIQIWKDSFSIFEIPAEEFARQLTIWSAGKFYAIERNELLNSAWENTRLMHRSPNVVALNKHSDQITNWVISTILMGKTLEQRLKIWSYFIQVTKHLFKMYNFYDTSSFVFALGSDQISRLKIHQEMLSLTDQKIINEIKPIFFDSSSKLIQEQHKIPMKKKVPSLPHLGVLLSFLGRYDASLPNKVDGLINVVKCTVTYKLIRDIEVFKDYKYNFLPIQQILDMIPNLDGIEEDAMSMISLEIEPEGITKSALLEMQNSSSN